MGAGDSLEVLQNSWKGVALEGAGQSRQKSRPGFAPHKESPLPGSLSQGGGPLGQEEPGSQLEARRLPKTRGEGQKGYCSSKPSLGCPKTPAGPCPQSAGPSLGQMENHSACKDTISLLRVKHCSSSFSIANTAGEPPLQEQRPQRKAVYTLLWPAHSGGAPAATYPRLGTSRKNDLCSQAHQFRWVEASQEVQLRVGASVLYPEPGVHQAQFPSQSRKALIGQGLASP